MFGQRLRLARQRAGLSIRTLAQQISPSVTPQAISKYENGKMLPSSTVLVGLGKALDVSLDFLMSTEVEKLDGLEFRKASRTTARDRAKAEAILIDNLERYLAIEEILDERATRDWSEYIRYDSLGSEDDIDGAADALREMWHLGMKPVMSMSNLLEDKGIKVIEDDLPERINGLACQALQGQKMIAEAVLVSKKTNIERKRFTLAHELAHTVIRSTGNPAIELETAMNRFAGAFLIPSQSLRDEVGRHRRHVTYYEIVQLKHSYGVSAAAMLIRLGQVGILQPARIRSAFSTFAKSWRKKEPDPIQVQHGFVDSEKPRRFKRLVLRALGEELISPIRAATLLQEPLDAVESQISG